MEKKQISPRLQLLALLFATVLSPHLYALGLGDAKVSSYLNQPLNARIQLIGGTAEELATVTAGMASAADFELMGLTRTVSVPLRFDVNTDPADAFVDVTSRLPVTAPVVQLVLEVTWAGGRMLREYTLFLDPPTFASKAPQPRVFSKSPAAVAGRQGYPDPASLNTVESNRVQPPGRIGESADKPVVPSDLPGTMPGGPARGADAEEIAGEQQDAVSGETAPGQPRQTVTVPSDPVVSETGSPADEVFSQPDSEPVNLNEMLTQSGLPESVAEQEDSVEDFAEPVAGDEILGPVQRGATLWSIASNIAGDYSDFSVNQAMLAIQRLNPDAFGVNNINLLHRGAILRLPTMSEIVRLNRQMARLEAIRQQQDYQAWRSGQPYDSIPAIADTASEAFAGAGDQGPPDSGTNVSGSSSEEARLQLIPPSEFEDVASTGGGSDEPPTGAVSSQEVEEVLARTEEELANAQQENAYLNERIQELEAQVAITNAAGTVVDDDLAEMEESLREKRIANEDEEPVVPALTRKAGPWYADSAWWIGGLLLLLIVAIVWFLRRFGGSDDPGDDGDEGGTQETVQSIRNEAEDILKSLDDTGEAPPQDDKIVDLDSYVDSEAGENEPESPVEPAEDTTEKSGKLFAVPKNEEEAVELDIEDPEVKLDMARAYLSMGDKDAARAMLDEVLEVGDEEQVREARGMMEEL
jgi:pilus assembly protein FimV